MKRLQMAKSGLQAAGMAGTTTAFEMQRTLLPDNLAIQAIMVLVALSAVIVGLGFIFNRLVDNFWVVRRVIVGRRRDIEGQWVDFTLDRDSGNLINVSFATISYQKGYYCFDGRGWYVGSTRAILWETLQSDYSNHSLTYRYDTWKSGEPRDREHGAGSLSFDKDRRVSRYTGEYIDIYHMHRCRTYGERVPERLFRNPELSNEQKRKMAEEYKDRRLVEVRLELGFDA